MIDKKGNPITQGATVRIEGTVKTMRAGNVSDDLTIAVDGMDIPVNSSSATLVKPEDTAHFWKSQLSGTHSNLISEQKAHADTAAKLTATEAELAALQSKIQTDLKSIAQSETSAPALEPQPAVVPGASVVQIAPVEPAAPSVS